ncbi:MAG: hypothetical protein Q4E16_04165 [Neisseria sp.]|nr:hypothetical protein [Neisseria sp.]
MLTAKAKKGIYAMPAPYRADMLPAKLGEMGINSAFIPLKNATLYGHRITGLNFIEVPETDHVGFWVDFAPMSDAQYRQLVKKVRFKFEENLCVEPGEVAYFGKEDDGRIFLAEVLGC